MNINKQEILENICYTELVYNRVNKKLSINFSKNKIESYLYKVLKETNINNFRKKGKNFYVMNFENEVKITINSNTFRVITVDKLKKIL